MAVLLLGGIGYRYTYGTFSPWSEPTRITWCGRIYLPGYTVSREQIGRFLPDGQTANDLRSVTRVPPLVGKEVFAAKEPANVASGPLCAMTVFLRTGTDTYQMFGLSGGP